MTKPRGKIREELTAEIEGGKKEIRRLENRHPDRFPEVSHRMAFFIHI